MTPLQGYLDPYTGRTSASCAMVALIGLEGLETSMTPLQGYLDPYTGRTSASCAMVALIGLNRGFASLLMLSRVKWIKADSVAKKDLGVSSHRSITKTAIVQDNLGGEASNG